jgi:hypothetical protein
MQRSFFCKLRRSQIPVGPARTRWGRCHELAKVVQSADMILELLYLKNFVDL